MATADAWISGYFLGLFIVASFIARAPGVRFCYNGTDIGSLAGLKNQSCASGEVHLLKSWFVTDHDTSPTYQDEESFDDDDSDDEEEDEDDDDNVHHMSEPIQEKSEHCLIFRYTSSLTLTSGITQESVHMEFGCDSRKICSGKEIGKVLFEVLVNGTQGQLFCCNTNNCNSAEELPHLPSENRVCYHGTNNKSEPATAEKKSCGHPDVKCARLTTFRPGGKLESYFCDNEKICESQMSSGAYRSCTNTTVNNTTLQEMCCCDASLCFEPSWVSASADMEEKNTTFSSVALHPNMHTIDKPTQASNDKLVITGLVAALVAIVGFGAGIIFVVACKKRRQPRRDPNVIMQYERLSASDPDIEDAVVL